MSQPIVSWFEGTNATANEVTGVVNYGTVDADTESGQKTFHIWNNRNGSSDVSKMEEVTFTTRDRLGGLGDGVGNIVEAVRDNWFNVRVDTLNEVTFVPVGKIGVKAVGTNGTTTNPNASTASIWATGVVKAVDAYVKPTVTNQFIYKVTVAGTTGGTEPAWSIIEGNVVTDGTVQYVAIKIAKVPAVQELLGVQNSVLANGTNASTAGANFATITVFADVPITASAGKNLLLQRVSYRYV